jgi:hypothetical protein
VGLDKTGFISLPDLFSFTLQASNMAALLSYADMTLRFSLFTLLMSVASSDSSGPSESNRTALEGRETATSAWWPLVECVFLTDVNKCLQDRTLRAFVGLGTGFKY